MRAIVIDGRRLGIKKRTPDDRNSWLKGLGISPA